MASVTSSGSTSSYNSSNPSVTSSSAIDVAGIVDQLMTVSKVPLTKLQNKMTQGGAIISDLTVLKSKIATFQGALTSLESPTSFNAVSATSVSMGATTAATVSATNGATIGRYSLNTTQVAESSNFSITGFTSATEVVTLNSGGVAGAGFDITIGVGSSAVTYNTATDYSSLTSPATTGGTLPRINSNTSTLTDLNSWINKLSSNFGVNIGSTIIQTTTGNYALSISGTQTGISNAIGFSGLNSKAVSTTTPLSVSGFTSAAEVVALNSGGVAGAGFDITIGVGSSAVTYNSATTYDTSTTPATTSGSLPSIDSSSSTLTDLNTWINQLNSKFGLNVSSTITQITIGNYALSISGTQTATIGFNGLNNKALSTATSSSSNSIASGNNVIVNTSAKDTLLSVNGLEVQRSSNTITDVINKATINLGSTGSSLITISSGTDNSSTVINSFITAYNDIISQYKAMTANPTNNPSLPKGSLSDAPTLLSFVSQIKQTLSSGALTASKSAISLSSLGIDFQSDGTMKFNKTNFTASQASGLLTTLSAGISVGGSINSSANLYTTVSSIVNPGGTIDSTITIQKTDILYTNSRAKALETQIERQRSGYISTYSKLNALLFQLSQASSQLTSSLTAITNINKG